MGKSIKTSVRAKCPRCDKMHRHYFEPGVFWSGKGTPRFRCSYCERTKESPYDLDLARHRQSEEDDLDIYDIMEYENEQSQSYNLNCL